MYFHHSAATFPDTGDRLAHRGLSNFLFPGKFYRAGELGEWHLDLKFSFLWLMLARRKQKGQTDYAIQFRCSGLNCRRDSFSIIKLWHGTARLASASTVVAPRPYYCGCHNVDRTQGEVNYLKEHKEACR